MQQVIKKIIKAGSTALFSMKGIVKSVALLPLLCLVSVPSGIAQTKDSASFEFSWDEDRPYTTLDKVRFANGQFIQVAEDKLTEKTYLRPMRDECEYRRLEVRNSSSGSLQYVSDACDGIVHIRAAYPNINNAKLAIVTTNCGGSMCSSWNDHFVVFLGESGVKVTRVGSSFYGPKNKRTKYGFGFDGKQLSRSSITNFYDGTENNLGDLVPSTRVFVNQEGYVDTRFNKKFLWLVGEHPDTAMGDEQARSVIVQKIQPERFRDFRAAMSGPGWSSVHNGRFIVMNACMKSNCHLEFGSVVIDGFTGAMHILRFSPEDNIFDQASSIPLKKEVDGRWLSEVDTRQKIQLSIEDGRLRATKKR